MAAHDRKQHQEEDSNHSDDANVYLEEEEQEDHDANQNSGYSPPFHSSYHSTNTHTSRTSTSGVEGGGDALLSQFAMSLTSLGSTSSHHQRPSTTNVLSNSLQELFEGVADKLDNVQDALESSHHSHDQFHDHNSDSDLDADEDMVQQPRMFDFQDVKPAEVQANVPFDTPKPVWRQSEDDEGELEPVLKKHKQKQQDQDDDSSSSSSESNSSNSSNSHHSREKGNKNTAQGSPSALKITQNSVTFAEEITTNIIEDDSVDDSEEQKRKSSKYFVSDPALKQMFRDAEAGVMDHSTDKSQDDPVVITPSRNVVASIASLLSEEEVTQRKSLLGEIKSRKSSMHFITDPALKEMFRDVRDDAMLDILEESQHENNSHGSDESHDPDSDNDDDDDDDSRAMAHPRMFDFQEDTPRHKQPKGVFDTPKHVDQNQDDIDSEAERGQIAAAEKKRLEQERRAAEAAAEQAAEKKLLDEQRLAAEKAEQERLEAEAERLLLEERRLAAEMAEQKRLEAEAERLLIEKETKRFEAEAAEKKLLAAEAAEQERLVLEAVEKNRIAAEAAKQERIEQELLAADASEKDRIEQDHLLALSAEKERLVQARLSTRISEQMRLEKERLAAELEAKAKEEEIRLKKQRQGEKSYTASSVASTPVRKKVETATAVSPTETVATVTSTVASTTPPRTEKKDSKHNDPAEPPSSANNEFQQIQLKKTNKNVERHIKETQLEFAEMIANALKKKTDSSQETSVEALRHIDNLKQDLATIPDGEEEKLRAIHKLREELLGIFNKGGALQEGYLLQWILPLHRERDPKTGRLVMSADQVALLQSFSTAEELDMVSGLGMVRSILQSNFKAINGLECLQAINDYAHFRLGKKVKRGPQTPWDILAKLFEKANKDEESSFDLHQRVRNALVLWVVREVLGTSKDEITSRNCMHAIYLIASLKLELQRVAPAALESGNDRPLIEDDLASNSFEDGSVASGKSSSRPPVIEKLLESKVLSSDETPTNPRGVSMSQTTPTAISPEQQQTSSSSEPVAKYDPEAMREAMIARDNSRKQVTNTEDTKPKGTDESELPLPVQDGHRVLRSILGPDHPQITVSDCFEAIRIYSSMIMTWKEVCEQQEKLLESGSMGSIPTLEEVRLRSLGALRLEGSEIDPPPHIDIKGPASESIPKQKKHITKKQKPVQKLEPPQEEKQEETSSEESHHAGDGKAAQLDIASMIAENPNTKGPIPTTAPSPTSTPSRDQASRSQRAAAATQAQAKTRKTLLGRLSRLNVSNKNRKSTKTADTSADVEDPRHPKKRRSMWKKFLGSS